MTVLTRSAGFVGAVFAPQVHVTYAVLWTAAYEALVAGHDWRPTGGTALRAATVLAMLLYLRLIDERKDESYDRVHHPDRPLVTGLVTAAELSRAGRIVMAVVLVANAFYSPWSAVVAAAFFGYAAMLTPLERRFPRLRDDPLVNIAVVYPVQLLIGVFLAVSAGSPAVRPLLVFAFAFLHFEFARKTAWAATPRMYSATALGPVGSALAALGFAVAACGFTGRWWPYAILVLPIAALAAFLSRRVPAWPKPAAMLFLIVLYSALIVDGVA
ncbi:hypothetical protein [Paractinoplanes durhamensis]|uniref:Prenyltransferase n=1 Tax=Paractinoplanes durhamensis TaxID=113563 RepID=A0ABQ3YV98_9ACTN|nr:hypothetical protein [Actinoplanes durhamensis]GIE01465.1 hypothetical protein Adu01nite_28150 [Actinoplanes durhamensis]